MVFKWIFGKPRRSYFFKEKLQATRTRKIKILFYRVDIRLSNKNIFHWSLAIAESPQSDFKIELLASRS